MDEEDERRKKKKKDFVYSRRRCLSRDNSYTSKDGRGLVSKVSLNSCQRGCRHRFPVDKAASARCGCSNDHLIRERKNERENKRVSRLGSMLRKKKKKRGGDRKKKKEAFSSIQHIRHTLLSIPSSLPRETRRRYRGSVPREIKLPTNDRQSNTVKF